jgi:hypothetical protein
MGSTRTLRSHWSLLLVLLVLRCSFPCWPGVSDRLETPAARSCDARWIAADGQVPWPLLLFNLRMPRTFVAL